MRRLRDLNLNSLSVTSDTLVINALLEMQKASVAAAGVLDENTLLGVITIEACVLTEPSLTVREVMRGASTRMDADEPVRHAAKSFVRQQADFMTVYDASGKYLGLLSALMLITELGRSWDPLTGLSWSDRLRDWGVECFEAGQEITVVFFDLNDFGAYNKRFGHLIGDRVIRGFAELLAKTIDPSRDVLVRYGGDEFAIGTTRSRKQTKSLLKTLDKRSFSLAGVEGEIGFSFGIAGGKRTQEPSRDHVAATLDNLINLASKDCQSKKPQAGDKLRELSEKLPQAARLVSTKTEPDGRITATVSKNGATASASSAEGQATIQCAMEAVIAALTALGETPQIAISDLLLGSEGGRKQVIIYATNFPGAPEPYVSKSELNGSLEHSIASAVLEIHNASLIACN